MQPPGTKVTSAGIAGALTILLLWGLSQYGIAIPTDVGGAIELLILGLVMVVTGYVVPERQIYQSQIDNAERRSRLRNAMEHQRER